MTVQQLAQELLEALRPGCERIEIVGSVRRGKAEPKDIELLAISKTGELLETVDFFGEVVEAVKINELADLVYGLTHFYQPTVWEMDAKLPRNGAKYKRLRHIETGVCCDLFIVTPETWGSQMVIRTGPADFSTMLVTRALRLGMKQEDGRLWRTHRDGTRTVIETPDEQSYFAALGLEYIAPELRGKVMA